MSAIVCSAVQDRSVSREWIHEWIASAVRRHSPEGGVSYGDTQQRYLALSHQCRRLGPIAKQSAAVCALHHHSLRILALPSETLARASLSGVVADAIARNST